MAVTIRMRIDEQPEHSYIFSTGDGGEIELIPLSVVANGSYTAPDGKAYNIVTVNVPETEVESLNITENGTYNAPDGKAYNVVTVDVEPILEAVSRTYSANGTYTIAPSSGKDGLSGVTVVVDVPTPSPRLQSKSESYSANGTYSVTPDTGYDGLSSVSVDVAVQGGGGASNIDVGVIDTGNMTPGSSNALFQFRANESPVAFYIYSDDPMLVSPPTGDGLILYGGDVAVNSGMPFMCYVAQSYFDGAQGQTIGYSSEDDLEQTIPDGTSERSVVGGVSNNTLYGWVMDMNNPSGFGLIGTYHYVVIYPEK